jgi:hypothetical protein
MKLTISKRKISTERKDLMYDVLSKRKSLFNHCNLNANLKHVCKRTGSRLDADWKWGGSIKKSFSGRVEAEWKQTGSGLEARWKD